MFSIHCPKCKYDIPGYQYKTMAEAKRKLPEAQQEQDEISERNGDNIQHDLTIIKMFTLVM